MSRLVLFVTLTVALTGCAGQTVRTAPPSDATVSAPSDLATPTQAAPAPSAPNASTPAPAVAAAPIADTPPVSAQQAPAAASDVGSDAAEDDYEAIYGGTNTTSAAGTSTALIDDPWEPMNRRIHAFNLVVDRAVMHPLARAYVTVIPEPIRIGIGNFFDNLSAPLATANLLLQGRPGAAVETLGRFMVNTTIGVGGLFDPATKQLKMHRHSADLGRTLARWGWQRSRYLELPLFGPSTVRDGLGRAGDFTLSPLNHIERDRVRVSLQALQAVDLRASLLSLDALRQSAPDDYVLTRDAWLARRQYLIDSDRKDRDEGSQALPPYLLEPSPTQP